MCTVGLATSWGRPPTPHQSLPPVQESFNQKLAWKSKKKRPEMDKIVQQNFPKRNDFFWFFPYPSSWPVQDVRSGPPNFYWELWFHGDMNGTQLPLFRVLRKKYRKVEYVQRRVCFVNEQVPWPHSKFCTSRLCMKMSSFLFLHACALSRMLYVSCGIPFSV